ncbi:putative membrane protein YedE/YeeE [Parabacteroides sp. PFB2-12]|uniref:hypothetical protein n=1 Tax=unclassified Parabacteroides TaxID=2649774 RepID=UPI00247E2287|nr:putative membrane protein YedE/YeeE [Parabacteroides sp. PM6-13]MDH6391897.1 putative membrane protein YedE/YeeE [Parabacteroides sp. PFB2-12]
MEEMQDRQLNEKESLELISRMIRNTQERMEEGSGTMFLIWGYTTVIVTMLVREMLMRTGSYQWQWLWFLLPVCGSIMTMIHLKKRSKKPRVITYVDKVINYIWTVLGITGFLLSVISIVYRLPILFFIVLIMGIGTTLTGLVINFRPLVIAGVLGMLLSSILVVRMPYTLQMLIFSLIFLVMMIIPGHYLNYKSRKRNV